MDDELNILPISDHLSQDVHPLTSKEALNKKIAEELQSLKDELAMK
jgi:hypothetical protein